MFEKNIVGWANGKRCRQKKRRGALLRPFRFLFALGKEIYFLIARIGKPT